jgi:hypothetical protein
VIAPQTAVAGRGPLVDPAKGDVIDRLAFLFQRARLWKRRERRRLADARTAADAPAACAALARYRRASHWERLTRAAYLRAVFAEYS